MARCLDTLAEAGALAQEWCVLDSQWFGVPQRRRRVFLTACFDPATTGRCPDQIFPVAKSGARNPAESNQERENVTRNAGSSTTESFRMLGFSHTQGLDAQPSTTAFPTLRKEGSGHAVAESNLAVRRLTPLECERLMGWPDNHTLHRADGKTNSDSARYKMCGNGVVAPVSAWVAKHLAALLQK